MANGSTDLAVTAFGFASGVLVARGLGPEGRGQLAAAMMWPTLAATLACLGLQHAVGYAAAAGWCSAQRLKQFAIHYTILVGVPTMLLFALACPYLFARSFPGETWKPTVFALSIPISIYASFLMPVYQGHGNFSRWNRSKLIRSGAWTIAVASLLIIGLATVLNLLIAQVTTLLMFASYLSVGFPRALVAGDERAVPVRQLFGYGLAVYLSGIAYMVNQQLDQLLLSLWVAPAQLGQYAAAVTVSGILLIVSGAIGPIMFTRIAREREELSAQTGIMTDGLWLSCSIFVPSAALLTFLAPRIISVLYGSRFAEAGVLLRIMAPAAVFLGVGEILATTVRAAGKPMLATYGIIGGLVVTVPGLVYALPRYGIWGAAWVSLVAYATMAMCQALLVWKLARSRRLASEMPTESRVAGAKANAERDIDLIAG